MREQAVDVDRELRRKLAHGYTMLTLTVELKHANVVDPLATEQSWCQHLEVVTHHTSALARGRWTHTVDTSVGASLACITKTGD
jgi:hypothetical protein